ncbi:MAG TPA: tetratricopeptide repeat protein [Jiangellaceae bacterium]|nr:tetratricopeptide repeat protein [Jiangellaceae bacterium]
MGNANALRHGIGGMYFESKQYRKAAAEFAEVVNEHPDNVGARMLLARSYYHSAQLGRAEAELRKILERDPNEDYAHLMLARTLERQSRAAEATPHRRIVEALTGQPAP